MSHCLKYKMAMGQYILSQYFHRLQKLDFRKKALLRLNESSSVTSGNFRSILRRKDREFRNFFIKLTKHFVNKNSKAPPVDGFSVTAVQNNFGREVFGRPTEGPCSITNSFSESEISQFHMTRSSWKKMLFKIWTVVYLNSIFTKNVLIIENVF